MSDIPHLPLTYEHDLFSSEGHQNTIDKVCAYLGVSSFQGKTNMKRVSAQKLSDDVSNFDEIIKFLQASSYAQHMNFNC